MRQRTEQSTGGNEAGAGGEDAGMATLSATENAEAALLLAGRHKDPFSFLGTHVAGEPGDGSVVVRAFVPRARALRMLTRDHVLIGHFLPTRYEGLFVIRIAQSVPYLLEVESPEGAELAEDPYAFGPLLDEVDLRLMTQGQHRELALCLGAHAMTVEQIEGVRFAVWAPNAFRVSVVGDFNRWDGRRHVMRCRPAAGVWEIFLPHVASGASYKYEIVSRDGRLLPLKTDPVALQCESPPNTASVVANSAPVRWTDHDWIARRPALQSAKAAISIYEVHAASWQHTEDGRPLDWDELAERLIPYVVDMGFSHLELMPIMEHALADPLGYEPLCLFAPSSRHGFPEDFARFVDRCHAAGLALILNWSPAHFPDDAHGMAQFDGTALYEYADPREGSPADRHTVPYNFSRPEVRQFLIASALLWLEHYHVDALRICAVAAMLYRDGGGKNAEAAAFLRELNQTVSERCPGITMIAGEARWIGVTEPVHRGGLGFSFQWNTGWVSEWMRDWGKDAPGQIARNAWRRRPLQASAEREILPISYDDVARGKGSLLSRMRGDHTQRLAMLRAWLTVMWTYPGKKLLFMGNEIAQTEAWNHEVPIGWELLNEPLHQAVQSLVRDLNHLYRNEAALHLGDTDIAGFTWLAGNDENDNVLSFLRRSAGARSLVVVCNTSAMPLNDYQVALPGNGDEDGTRCWREILSSGMGIHGVAPYDYAPGIITRPTGLPHPRTTLTLTLPPLSTRVLGDEAL